MIYVNNVVAQIPFYASGHYVGITEQKVDIAVKFYHRITGNAKNRGRLTRCEIVYAPVGTFFHAHTGTILGAGETKVFSGNHLTKPDRFDRRIGRRESLIRALADTDLSKEVKAKIWTAYRAKCKMPNQTRIDEYIPA